MTRRRRRRRYRAYQQRRGTRRPRRRGTGCWEAPPRPTARRNERLKQRRRPRGSPPLQMVAAWMARLSRWLAAWSACRTAAGTWRLRQVCSWRRLPRPTGDYQRPARHRHWRWHQWRRARPPAQERRRHGWLHAPQCPSHPTPPTQRHRSRRLGASDGTPALRHAKRPRSRSLPCIGACPTSDGRQQRRQTRRQRRRQESERSHPSSRDARERRARRATQRAATAGRSWRRCC